MFYKMRFTERSPNTDARDSDVSIMFKEALEAFGYGPWRS